MDLGEMNIVVKKARHELNSALKDGNRIEAVTIAKRYLGLCGGSFEEQVMTENLKEVYDCCLFAAS